MIKPKAQYAVGAVNLTARLIFNACKTHCLLIVPPSIIFQSIFHKHTLNHA